jgi:hypothetical protein
MSSYRYGHPALKHSVDVQLQTAFSDGNWNTVIRLAAKRAATLKDPYYEVRHVKYFLRNDIDIDSYSPPHRPSRCVPSRSSTARLKSVPR